jgi:50S ribosomal protein L16 3-hydroxylase
MKSANPIPHSLPTADQPLALLGGLTPEQFLRDYWHKKPLLIRQAIPDFSGILSPDELAGLSCEEDVQSRLVIQQGGQWRLEHGPFAESRFAKLPERDWTLLVQSLNHHLPEAQQLMQQFSFLPYARLDDLMVSYAPDGGGVGPHFDSYDVFLLQGMGQRRWRISEQKDLSLVEGVPLKILQHFETQEEWVLQAGDMLYLPPHLAHWGIAVGDCMTYSIGFRAPSHQELIHAMLSFLQDQEWGDERYSDPDLTMSNQPALISNDMIGKVNSILQKIKITPELVGSFLASYLSEPKPHVVIDMPRKISLQQFQQRAKQQGLRLTLKSQLLYVGDAFYLNGEQMAVESDNIPMMRDLANLQMLTNFQLCEIDTELIWEMLHNIYLQGCICFGD